jgi:hypothetical protein
LAQKKSVKETVPRRKNKLSQGKKSSWEEKEEKKNKILTK